MVTAVKRAIQVSKALPAPEDFQVQSDRAALKAMKASQAHQDRPDLQDHPDQKAPGDQKVKVASKGLPDLLETFRLLTVTMERPVRVFAAAVLFYALKGATMHRHPPSVVCLCVLNIVNSPRLMQSWAPIKMLVIPFL